MKNYLPFAQREITPVLAGGAGQTGVPTSVRMDSMAVGHQGRVVLGDVNVYVVLADGSFAGNRILMRMGWLSKGYLLERRLPVGAFINKGRPLVSTWSFPRPYRLKANARLRATLNAGETTARYQGIMFNGVRCEDRRPMMLYDGNEAESTALLPFNGMNLYAPTDSDVELYSVSIPEYQYSRADNATAVRIWGPGNREWFKVQPYVAAPAGMGNYTRWIDPPGDLIEMERHRGWEVDSDETLLIEYENTTAVNAVIVTTLRGSLEVDHG